MLDYNTRRAYDLMAQVDRVTIATCGPAGILVGEFPCRSAGLDLYVSLPVTSDHLFNLENDPNITLCCPQWELYGRIQIIPAVALPPSLTSQADCYTGYCEWIRILPVKLQIRKATGWGYTETIDFNTSPPG